MDAELVARASQWLSGPPHAALIPPRDVPAADWGPAVIEAAMAWEGYLWQLLPYARYATPEQKIAIVIRCGTPNRDAVLEWMRPLDAATVTALESAALELTPRKNQLLDRPVTLLALVWIVALGELGHAIPTTLDQFLECDLELFDHQLFDLTRAALAAVPAPRRVAIVMGALAKGRMLAVHTLTEFQDQPTVLAAALDQVIQYAKHPLYAPTLAHGLAGGGPAMVPLILERLASGRANGAEPTLIWALSEIEDPRAIPALLEQVRGTKRVPRLEASLALYHLAPLDRDPIEAGAKARKKIVAATCRFALEVADHPELGRMRALWRELPEVRRRELANLLTERGDVFDRVKEWGVVAVLGAIAWAMEYDKHMVRNRIGLSRRTNAEDCSTAWALAYALLCWPLYGVVREAVEAELRECGAPGVEAARFVFRAPELTPDRAMERWLSQHP